MARQICDGANRLHPVSRWPKGDKVQCSHCSLKLTGERVVRKGDLDPDSGKQRLYISTPNHRPVGAPKIGEIDWSLEG